MRNRYVLLADLPLVVIAAYGAFALRFDWLFLPSHPEFPSFVIAALLLKPVVFHLFGMYQRYWRYATAQDLLAITLAVSSASVAIATWVGLGFALRIVPQFSRQVLAIDWLLTLALAGGLRMSVRVVGDARRLALKGNGRGWRKRVLVAGAGEAGSLVVREMQKNPQLGMSVVGFLDDDAAKVAKRIYGVTVLGRLASLEQIVAAHAVQQVIIAMPTASGRVVRSVAESCRRAGVESRTVPGVFELLDGKISVNRLRQVEIADLLRRSQVVSSPKVSRYLEGRTVLITGAGGSIGSELGRQVAHARPARLVLVGHGENTIFDVHEQLRNDFPEVALSSVIADIRDRQRLSNVFAGWRPDIVFHAAAHKHVSLMEQNPEEAITNNVLGTQNVVDAARAVGVARLVMISSDKAVSPTCIMGASKRVAEAIVRQRAADGGPAFMVVRFGNVLGSRGSVVPLFKRQIEQGGPITITHPEMKRFFMTIPEAIHLVLQAGGIGRGGELFVLDMGEQIAIVDLAHELVRLSGLAPADIPITYTGIRPGEKLEEALSEEGADVQPTVHPEILHVSEASGCREPELSALVQSLARAAEVGDRMTIEALLMQAVPTYVSSYDPVSAAGNAGAPTA